jgi:hypothetical protein
MAKYVSKSLGSRAAVESGTPVDVSDLSPNFSVIVSGTFTATCHVEISHDGTNFLQHGSNVTAPALVTGIPKCKSIRLRCSSYTSGTAVGVVGGEDPNRLA